MTNFNALLTRNCAANWHLLEFVITIDESSNAIFNRNAKRQSKQLILLFLSI